VVFYWGAADGSGASTLPSVVFEHGTIERVDFDDRPRGERVRGEDLGPITIGTFPVFTEAVVAEWAFLGLPASEPHLLGVGPTNDKPVTVTIELRQPAARVSVALRGLPAPWVEVDVTVNNDTNIPSHSFPVGTGTGDYWLGVAAEENVITRVALTTEAPNEYGYGMDDIQIGYEAPEPATATLMLCLAGAWASSGCRRRRIMRLREAGQQH